MSAETLRQASAQMRERAVKAEARRWYPSDEHDGMDEMLWLDICADFPGDDPINRYVESWPPAVALAVADWLEGVAAWTDEGLGTTRDLNRTNWPSMWGDAQTCALAVATAYLGEQP